MNDFFALEKSPVPDLDWPADFEAQFWRAYPNRIAKIAAMKVLRKIHKSRAVSWAKLIGAVERYKSWLSERSQKVWRPEPAHPASWLNAGRWDDDIPVPKSVGYRAPQIEQQLRERAEYERIAEERKSRQTYEEIQADLAKRGVFIGANNPPAAKQQLKNHFGITDEQWDAIPDAPR